MNARSDAYLQNNVQYNIKAKRRVQSREKVKKRKSGFFSTLVLLILIFGMLSLLVWGYQGIFATENHLSSVREKISELEIANDKLTLQIAASEDIGEIQRIASEKLNMGFPEEDQIITVNIPKTQTEEKVESVEVNVFALIKSILE